MKIGTKFLLVFAFVAMAGTAFAQNASVQFVHNSPYYEVDSLTIYVNDVKFVDKLAYNEATAFLDVAAGESVKVDIVYKDAVDNTNPLHTETVAITADERYVVFVAGNPYDTESDNTHPFGFYGLEGVQSAVVTSGNAEFVLFHGSPDAPAVAVGMREAGLEVDSLGFGEFTEYFSAAAANDVLEVSVYATGFGLASYVAPLSGLGDQSFAVYTRGVYNNANKYDNFGMSAVFADGSVVDLEKAAEPNYPYPVDPETQAFGSEIFFQDGYNLAIPGRESVTNVLAYADMPGNKVLRLTPADYGARGFTYPEGRNMEVNIDRVDTLYVRMRVLPDDPVLNLMIADMSDSNPSQAEKDYGFQVNWSIPDTMYNGKWYSLAIPLPMKTKALQDTAVAHGTLDPLRARWRYVDAWSGSYNIGPSDPLWKDMTWYNIRFVGMTHAASGSATAEFDYIYLGKWNDFDFASANSVPTSPMPQLTVSDNASHDTLVVTWNHDSNSDIAGYELYFSGDNIGKYSDPGQNRAGIYSGAASYSFRLPYAGIDPNNLGLNYSFMLYPSNQYSYIPADAQPSKSSINVNGKARPYIYGLTASEEDAIVANFDANKAAADGFRGEVFFNLDHANLVNDAGNDPWNGVDDASGKVWMAYRNNTTEGYTTFYLYAEIKDDNMFEIATWDPENTAAGTGTWIHDIDAAKKDGSLPWNVYGDEQLMLFLGTYSVNPATGGSGLRKRGATPDYFISYMPYVGTSDKRNGGVPDGLVSRLWLEHAGTENNGVGDSTYYYNSNHPFVYPTVFEMMYDANNNYIGWKILAAIDAEDLIADEGQTDTKFVAPADNATMTIPFALNLVDRDAGSPWWGSGHELWYNTKGYRPLEETSSVSGIGSVAVLGKDVVVTSNENGSPKDALSFNLNQNYPNPFNPTTNIAFTIPKANNVTISVYNVLGQKVATLMNNQLLNAGQHNVSFDARNLSSGVYFYRLEAGSFVASKKMMLIK
ncbi:DUF4397 domain-containing protein [bacterium]|nr:MAG: DUF4397 domain-containing protein [bacterium]